MFGSSTGIAQGTLAQMTNVLPSSTAWQPFFFALEILSHIYNSHGELNVHLFSPFIFYHLLKNMRKIVCKYMYVSSIILFHYLNLLKDIAFYIILYLSLHFTYYRLSLKLYTFRIQLY